MKKLMYLIILIFSSSIVFGSNVVITSIQPLYSITSYLTKGTNIKVYSAFGSDVSMTMSKEEIKNEEFNLQIAKNAQAVIDIAKVWNDDLIYTRARQENIKIIEIDASHPYDLKAPKLYIASYSDGELNPYIWMSNKNLVKMANIIAKDLYKIYPSQKRAIEKNLISFTEKVRNEELNVGEELAKAKTTEVISLSQNLKYFLDDLNIYTEELDSKEINENNITDIIMKKGIKTFVSDRWIKKNLIKSIKDAGGEFIVINTLDIPMEENEKMDKDAIFKAYNENTENLLKALNK